MMKTIVLMLSFLATIVFCGCGNDNLDAATAKKLILEKEKYPRVFDYDVSCGDMTVAKEFLDLGLEEQGLVTIMKSQTMSQLSMPWITFTEKSKPYLLPRSEQDLKYKGQPVKLADLTFGEIKGIVMGKDGKVAMVQYSLLYKNLTPFIKLIKRDLNKEELHKAYFVRYDTGWQMDKNGEILFMGIR
ncbi:hypothetical protein [Pedobacter nutrimenti]|uniref:hypothetical protein n=1 Tax=Pedobacter nutrimenti TaxID=1241337 RepID=UPI00292D5F8C|nr:hypothetical protein [Pedobacter nutrimenti]